MERFSGPGTVRVRAGPDRLRGPRRGRERGPGREFARACRGRVGTAARGPRHGRRRGGRGGRRHVRCLRGRRNPDHPARRRVADLSGERAGAAVGHHAAPGPASATGPYRGAAEPRRGRARRAPAPLRGQGDRKVAASHPGLAERVPPVSATGSGRCGLQATREALVHRRFGSRVGSPALPRGPGRRVREPPACRLSLRPRSAALPWVRRRRPGPTVTRRVCLHRRPCRRASRRRPRGRPRRRSWETRRPR